jgi:hypothetical protein
MFAIVDAPARRQQRNLTDSILIARCW